ncbi:uncharacterized protein LOC106997202 isoform X2 [Macaca mulatta]
MACPHAQPFRGLASGSLQARGSSGVGAGGGHPWGCGRREPEETQEGDPRTAGPGWSWRGHSGGRGGAQSPRGRPPSQRMGGRRNWSPHPGQGPFLEGSPAGFSPSPWFGLPPSPASRGRCPTGWSRWRRGRASLERLAAASGTVSAQTETISREMCVLQPATE